MESTRSFRQKSRSDTREALIWVGTEMCTERGFQVTRIEEVLKRAGVPKGSFYHFFRDKQQFGEAVIDNYGNYFLRKLDRLLSNMDRTPLDRLREFTQEAARGMARFDFQRGCLIGNLGQELGGLNQEFRGRLEAILLQWQERTARCLTEAVDAGQLAHDTDVDRLSEYFWIGWEGAILRSKLSRSVRPIEIFADKFFESLAPSLNREASRA